MASAQEFERILGDKDYAVYRRRVSNRMSDAAACGDWNGDGMITNDDVRVIAQAIMKGRACPPRVCDADGDGAVRYGDVMRMRKRIGDPAAALACPP
jgi:hypothetical protein